MEAVLPFVNGLASVTLGAQTLPALAAAVPEVVAATEIATIVPTVVAAATGFAKIASIAVGAATEIATVASATAVVAAPGFVAIAAPLELLEIGSTMLTVLPEVLPAISPLVVPHIVIPGLIGVAAGAAVLGTTVGILNLISSESSSDNNDDNSRRNSSCSGGSEAKASSNQTQNQCTGESGNQNQTDDASEGSGNGGNGGDRNGGDRRGQHERDLDGEENEEQDQPQQSRSASSKRKARTAWLKPVFYPEAPTRAPVSPSDEIYKIRLQMSKIVRLEHPGENGFFPRQHLLYRWRMQLYGSGRLQKLCRELGLDVKDICKFGTSIYKDSRAEMVAKLSTVHAAHVFPVTDFDFGTIHQRLSETYSNATQGQIDSLIKRTDNILMNMVGQTDYVQSQYNESGSVGRALDNFLKDSLQAGNTNITSDNIQGTVNSFVECLKSSINDVTQNEIEETIKSIESTSVDEWIDLFSSGLNGEYDDHFDISRRYIDPNYREAALRSRNDNRA